MFKLRSSQPIFRDRKEAGIRLAAALTPILSAVKPNDIIVVGLARGGVPVAYEIARHVGGTLDAWSIRKIGAPGQPELAIGAVGPGHTRILNQSVIRDLQLAPATIQTLSCRAADERNHIDNVLRNGSEITALNDRVLVLVDDGLATGASMHAALAAAERQHPRRTIVAIPVAPPDVVDGFRARDVEIVTLLEPADFRSVSTWYHSFPPVSVATVRTLLDGADRSPLPPHHE